MFNWGTATVKQHQPDNAQCNNAEKTLQEALAPVTAVGTQVMDGFRELALSPQEIEIAFGVMLDCKLGGVIATANTGARLDVTLRWRGSGAAGETTHELDYPARVFFHRKDAQRISPAKALG